MKTIDLIQGEIGLELENANGNWVLKSELGYSPVQMLVSSIAGCGGYVFSSILEKSQIDFTMTKIHVEYEEDFSLKSHPLKRVNIQFFGQADEGNYEKANRALRLVNEYCPVMQSLDPKIEITKTVVFE